MKTNALGTALAVLFSSAVALAGPAPAAAPAKGPMPYPLSCSAEAKPLYEQAFTEMFNSHGDTARETLKQALVKDPKCVMAKLQLAQLTPAPEGKKLFDEAAASAGSLTGLEKLDFEAMQANNAGDHAKAFELRQQAAQQYPQVFSAQLRLVMAANMLDKHDEALAAAKKATELDPKSGAAWNQLGYANVNLKKYADAVAAFKKYVEVSPNEPNAHDSLADALLADDQLDQAGAEYQKAIDASGGKFWNSWSGVATVKALKGDYAGAREAMAKSAEGAPTPTEKIFMGYWGAMALAAGGKVPEALKAVDAAEKQAAAQKLALPQAWGALTRAAIALDAGKYADALKQTAAAEKVKLDGVVENDQREVAAIRLHHKALAEARLGKVKDLEKTLTELDALFKTTPPNPGLANEVMHAHGEALLAKKDAKGAVEELKKCNDQGDWCRLTLAEAQEKAGDAAAAAETRTALVKANHRDPFYWMVRAKAEAALKVPGKKVAQDAVKK